MESPYFFDSRSLREHVSEVEEERRAAQRLRDAVVNARDTGDPALRWEYNRVIDSVDRVRRYFAKMAEVLDDAADMAIRLSAEIRSIVSNDTDRVRAENQRIQV